MNAPLIPAAALEPRADETAKARALFAGIKSRGEARIELSYAMGDVEELVAAIGRGDDYDRLIAPIILRSMLAHRRAYVEWMQAHVEAVPAPVSAVAA